jgi:hypothetical protein
MHFSQDMSPTGHQQISDVSSINDYKYEIWASLSSVLMGIDSKFWKRKIYLT